MSSDHSNPSAPFASYPRVVLFQKFMRNRGIPVPPGLSDAEIVRRVDYLVQERCVGAYVVWNESRMTRIVPIGPPREEATDPRVLSVSGMLSEPLPPVPGPDEPLPAHLQVRRFLTGRWAVAYPDGMFGWTPLEDSTLDLRTDGTYTWRSPLPWFADGLTWSASVSGSGIVLGLHSRYHWNDHHPLIRVPLPEAHANWFWRTRDGRDILWAVKDED